MRLLMAISAGIAGLGGTLRGQAVSRPPISLVVLVSIDQMRADYLARFAGQWTGGFARIYRGGTVFEHGEQDHAATETAPGHSTMLSGRYPAHTGIALNSRGVQDPTAPILGTGSDTVGASPRRFRGTTLYDWMLARDPDVRVLSVSRKDRAAIFPIGRARAPVYWLNAGTFTTSRYYADSLPSWVQAFDRRIDVQRLSSTTWNLLLPDTAYAEPDSMPFENSGADVTFPHRLSTVPGAAARRLNALPWIDSLTLAFALEGVQALGLGRRNHPDLLSISLSTTDAVGHAFGPDSREIHDQLLRADRWLGQFLDSLGGLLPNANTVVVLTGDHGVSSLPEYTVTVRHRLAGRVWLGGLARKANATGLGLDVDGGLLLVNLDSLRARGVNADSLAEGLATEAASLPGVARVYTARTLAQAADTDRAATLWRHLLPADYGWLICATTKPGYVWSNGGLDAEHGSANPDDIAVPIAFYGKGIAAQHIERPVSTVDIAPTLAALLRVSPLERLDGHVLPEVSHR
jgi:predicted AlkP superfamily pyrophosphatase or phosphodiesterase